MKVVYHEDYNEIYSSDPASAAGRIQAVEIALRGKVSFVTPLPVQSAHCRTCKVDRARRCL
jgi:hypothetical protein